MNNIDTTCDLKTARTLLRNASEFESLEDLCSTYSVSTREVEGAIAKYSLPYPNFLTDLEREIQQVYPSLKEQKWTQLEIARHFGVTIPTLRFILTKIGYIYSKRENRDEILNIKHLIITRGMKLSHAVALTPFCRLPVKKVASVLLAQGFDLYAYEGAWQRFGNWEVQPARRRLSATGKTETVYCRCLECGDCYWVSRNLLVSKRSHRCMSCSSNYKNNLVIVDGIRKVSYPSIAECVRYYSEDTRVTNTRLSHHLSHYGIFNEEGFKLRVKDIENEPVFQYKLDIFDDVTVKERLEAVPYPNDDPNLNGVSDTRGLVRLRKAQAGEEIDEETAPPIQIGRTRLVKR